MENLYVGDLSFFCTTEHVRKLFEPYGPLESAGVRFSQRKGTTLHYGFVSLPANQAQKAIDELNKKLFMGRRLRVTYCTRMADEHEHNPSGVSIHLSFLTHMNTTVVNEEYLRKTFEPFGGLVDVVVKHWAHETISSNSTSQKQHGYAFFLMENHDSAQKLLQTLDSIHGNCLDNIRYDGKITATLQKAENAPKANPQSKLYNGMNGNLNHILYQSPPYVSNVPSAVEVAEKHRTMLNMMSTMSNHASPPPPVLHCPPSDLSTMQQINKPVTIMTMTNNIQVPLHTAIVSPAVMISTPSSISSIKSTGTDGTSFAPSTADANRIHHAAHLVNQYATHATPSPPSPVEHQQSPPVHNQSSSFVGYTYSTSPPAQVSHVSYAPIQNHLPPFPHTFTHKQPEDMSNAMMLHNIYYSHPSMDMGKAVTAMHVPIPNNLVPRAMPVSQINYPQQQQHHQQQQQQTFQQFHPVHVLQHYPQVHSTHLGISPPQPYPRFPPVTHQVQVPSPQTQPAFQYMGVQPMISSPLRGTQQFVSHPSAPTSMIMH